VIPVLRFVSVPGAHFDSIRVHGLVRRLRPSAVRPVLLRLREVAPLVMKMEMQAWRRAR
jgi:hypothetical protein